VSVAHYSKTVSSKFNLMKYVLTSLAFLSIVSAAFANTPPTPQVLSAAMRDGTTIMDITYRVDDPDDATVKVRALAFVDGVRSFANVLRPTNFVEGTDANMGDAVAANTDLTLAWDVGADWDIDLGQVKFEILAMDGRGLLAFDWITIPAAGGEPELIISKDTPSNAAVLDAFFWQYAVGDTGLVLENGVLRGTAASGIFAGLDFVNGAAPQVYATPFVLKLMNLAPADLSEVNYADVTTRAGLLNSGSWHATNHPYDDIAILLGWGNNYSGQTGIPAGLTNVTAIAAGTNHSLALKNDGTVVGWGRNDYYGQTDIPVSLSGVTAIAAGDNHSLALKSDGIVVGWGNTDVPVGLTGVTAIAAGDNHSLALKSDGIVVGWGSNAQGATDIPAGLSGVTAIDAGERYSLALKGDGTVVGWGSNSGGRTDIPAGLSGVTTIAAGDDHSLALKSDGTVVGWGSNTIGQTDIPAGLNGVTAIAAGGSYSLALQPNTP
jgi:hypothetical protein